MTANQLYFGDNLFVLRERIRGESTDLICLDPPFEGLMGGTERARYPDVAAGAHTFKKARSEQQAAEGKRRYRAGK